MVGTKADSRVGAKTGVKPGLAAIMRTALVTLVLCAFATALAGLGDPTAVLLEDLVAYDPVAAEGGYTAADGFAFAVSSVDDIATGVTGEGRLSDANVRFLGALLAAASGYGEDLAAPIADFFRTRAAEFNGAGAVPIQVVDYSLTATISGAAPGYLEFSFEPTVVSGSLFPAAAHSLGASAAPYVIRVFSDFQCPFCANFVAQAMPIVDELLERDDVRFELHHFPLRSIHPNANVAAEASECVAVEGGEEAFWTFHDALFEQQQRWAGLVDPVDTFATMAEELQLPHESLNSCLRSGEFSDDIEVAYRAAAEQLMLTGTPTVFLNGLKVGDYDELENYLRLMRLSDALSKAAEDDAAADEAAVQGSEAAATGGADEPGQAP